MLRSGTSGLERHTVAPPEHRLPPIQGDSSDRHGERRRQMGQIRRSRAVCRSTARRARRRPGMGHSWASRQTNDAVERRVEAGTCAMHDVGHDALHHQQHPAEEQEVGPDPQPRRCAPRRPAKPLTIGNQASPPGTIRPRCRSTAGPRARTSAVRSASSRSAPRIRCALSVIAPIRTCPIALPLGCAQRAHQAPVQDRQPAVAGQQQVAGVRVGMEQCFRCGRPEWVSDERQGDLPCHLAVVDQRVCLVLGHLPAVDALHRRDPWRRPGKKPGTWTIDSRSA